MNKKMYVIKLTQEFGPSLIAGIADRETAEAAFGMIVNDNFPEGGLEPLKVETVASVLVGNTEAMVLRVVVDGLPTNKMATLVVTAEVTEGSEL